MIESLTDVELDRHHEQARIGLREALDDGDEIAYRHAEALERKTRREKIRRAAQREGRV